MKGTLGIPLNTALGKPVVGITGTGGLVTVVLSEIGFEEVKFNDTIGVACVLDICVLTCGGDTPPTNITEVGV